MEQSTLQKGEIEISSAESEVNFCAALPLSYLWLMTRDDVGIFVMIHSFLGDLKESPSLGESSHVMFSRMAKYSSLTAFYSFSEQQPKAIEDKVCLHQS